MRSPTRPPASDQLWEGLRPGRLGEILERVKEPSVGGEYLPWDKLRHRTPPPGLSLPEWWLGLRLRRLGQAKAIPLRDIKGSGFTFNQADPIPQRLHEIDRAAGGPVPVPEAVTNPDTRDRYLVRSLMEEAISSSQLEGAATTREAAKEMIRRGLPPRDQGERMILNNFQTMERIIQIKDQEFSRELVFELHRMVTEKTLKDEAAAGRFRREDESCIVGDDFGEIFHVPPPAGELPDRMAAMIDFANGETPDDFLHPALRSIILHFWLAYDHPFVDGNGRTARALFYWSMLKHGYWLFEYISVSRSLLRAPAKYGRAFLYTETDDNDLTYFLIYHLDIIKESIRDLYGYLERRTSRLRRLEEELRGMAALNHRQRDLISHALRHPGFMYTIESHRKSQSVVYQTARTDLLDLVGRKLLTKHKEGKAYYFTPADDLEARLRRPR